MSREGVLDNNKLTEILAGLGTQSAGTMAYAVPEMVSLYGIVYPPVEEQPSPLWPPPPSPPIDWPLIFRGLTDDDRALLKRIEEKLDELLNRTAPEADVIAEIRKRVDAVIAGFGKKEKP